MIAARLDHRRAITPCPLACRKWRIPRNNGAGLCGLRRALRPWGRRCPDRCRPFSHRRCACVHDQHCPLCLLCLWMCCCRSPPCCCKPRTLPRRRIPLPATGGLRLPAGAAASRSCYLLCRAPRVFSPCCGGAVPTCPTSFPTMGSLCPPGHVAASRLCCLPSRTPLELAPHCGGAVPASSTPHGTFFRHRRRNPIGRRPRRPTPPSRRCRRRRRRCCQKRQILVSLISGRIRNRLTSLTAPLLRN